MSQTPQHTVFSVMSFPKKENRTLCPALQLAILSFCTSVLKASRRCNNTESLDSTAMASSALCPVLRETKPLG